MSKATRVKDVRVKNQRTAQHKILRKITYICWITDVTETDMSLKYCQKTFKNKSTENILLRNVAFRGRKISFLCTICKARKDTHIFFGRFLTVLTYNPRAKNFVPLFLN